MYTEIRLRADLNLAEFERDHAQLRAILLDMQLAHHEAAKRRGVELPIETWAREAKERKGES